MNKVQELIRKLPAMCGAKDSWGRSGELQYMDELTHSEPFKRVEGESFHDRCVSYVAFEHFCTDVAKANYGIGLLQIVDAHSKGDEATMNELIIELEPVAHLFTDVSNIMTLKEATESFWAP
jgi:hypothetical protein